MQDSATIKRNYAEFSRVWPQMWLAFNKPLPSRDFTTDVWTQCQYIPAEAWGYMLDCVRDLDAMPRNWAKKLKALNYQWGETQGRVAEPEIEPRGAEGPIGLKMRELKNQNPNLGGLELLGLAMRHARAVQWTSGRP